MEFVHCDSDMFQITFLDALEATDTRGHGSLQVRKARGDEFVVQNPAHLDHFDHHLHLFAPLGQKAVDVCQRLHSPQAKEMKI